MFKLNVKEKGTINDNGTQDLPVGKHNYVITEMTYAKVKSDPSGKRHHIIMNLRSSAGASCKKFFEVEERADADESEETRARIAAQEMGAFIQAAGWDIEKDFTERNFKAVYGVEIGVEVVERKSKTSDKVFINVAFVGAPYEEDGEEEPKPAPKKKVVKKKAAPKKPEPEEEPEEEEEEESEEETEEDDEEENPWG